MSVKFILTTLYLSFLVVVSADYIPEACLSRSDKWSGRWIGTKASNYDLLLDEVKVSHHLEALYFCEEELIWT